MRRNTRIRGPPVGQFLAEELTMKRVAVFGNAGGGKSTLGRRLAELTGLPLYVVDMMQFRPGGAKVPNDEFLQVHADLLLRDEWIIDGFGNLAVAWERFAAADTLIYIDLPLFIHFRWVTKRLIKGLFADPPGWPKNSPLWSSSIQSYRVLWPCHRYLTPKYRKLVADEATSKRVHHLRSPAQIQSFLEGVKNKHLEAVIHGLHDRRAL
jgi:adenylate kinase family enzyme